jgi:hypothetical protein
VHDDRRARLVLPIAIFALLLWPLSYISTRTAGPGPVPGPAVGPLVEIAAIVLASVAIWLGMFVTRDGGNTRSSDRGMRLGMLVVVLVIGGNLIGQGLAG